MLELGKVVFLPVTARAGEVARRLSDHFPGSVIRPLSRENLSAEWQRGTGLVIVGACGVAVRMIAPLIRDKKEDPAVVVVDETGRRVISLLSGHLGGANALARELAALLGTEPVITTATDLAGLVAPDLWAEEVGALLLPEERIPSFTSAYLRRGTLRVLREYPLPLPPGWREVSGEDEADLVISYRRRDLPEGKLQAVPRVLFVGLGFHRNTPENRLEEALLRVLARHGLREEALAGLATLETRAGEPELRSWSARKGLRVFPFPPEVLSRCTRERGLSVSEAARRATGALAVAEPAALLAAGPGSRLIVPKERVSGITVAVAEARRPKGRLYLVGIGTGAPEEMTPAARRALREATHVVGYTRYLDLVRPLLGGKEVFATGMTREVERAEKALELARAGHRVALVSGGDPGIYGLAGLVFELMQARGFGAELEVEVIPGLTALNACAARLGAPLMHDFAVISLSDRLTPWEVIERRLRAAARADFVIVIYNPRSRGRPDHLERARKILLEYRSPETPVGIVRAAGRTGERILLSTLGEFPVEEVDMQSTVFVGNSESFRFGPWLVTPRGYRGRRF